MSSLSERLREIGESCPRYGDMELVGAIAVDVVPSLIRAIRVLIDERNDWIGCIDDVTEKAKDAIRRRSDAAVLAALDAKETT